MKPGGQRAKGHAFERWVANALRDALGLVKGESRRGLSQSRGGGAEESDVVVRGLPFHFECKHSGEDTPRTALRQAVGDLEKSGKGSLLTPLAVVKRNGQKPVVGMFAEDFQRLLTSWRWSRPYMGPDSPTSPAMLFNPLRPRDEAHPLVTMTWAEFLVVFVPVALATLHPAEAALVVTPGLRSA